MIVGKEFNFSAAHYLPGHGKCGIMHGHNYRVLIELEGPICSDGMVADFGNIKEYIQPYIEETFDHRCLNEVMGIPTAESIVMKMVNKFNSMFIPRYVKLHSVTVWETPTCYAKWEKKE